MKPIHLSPRSHNYQDSAVIGSSGPFFFSFLPFAVVFQSKSQTSCHLTFLFLVCIPKRRNISCYFKHMVLVERPFRKVFPSTDSGVGSTARGWISEASAFPGSQ